MKYDEQMNKLSTNLELIWRCTGYFENSNELADHHWVPADGALINNTIMLRMTYYSTQFRRAYKNMGELIIQ